MTTQVPASGRARTRRPKGRPLVRADPFLLWLATDPALAAGRQPIHAIVEKLARTVDVECACVGEVLDTVPEMVRTVAWWGDGRHLEDDVHPAARSPCESAVGGRPSYYPSRVARLFPQAGSLAEGIEAFAAHPLTSLEGVRLGHISVMSRRRFRDAGRIRRLLAACAPRVAGEVERLRRERQMPDSIRRAETLLREAHHRVKNNLQILASLLTMQASATSEASVRDALSDAISRISTIALIHAQLSDGPNVASVDMRVFVQDLVRNVQRSVADSTTAVAISLSLDALTLPLQLATPCGLLISELVTNAYQHAFAHTGSGLITIRLTADDDVVTIVVRDNGPGLPPDAGRHEAGGLGLELIRLLATKQLHGEVSIACRGGTEFTVRFPHDTQSPPTDRASGTHHFSGGQDG